MSTLKGKVTLNTEAFKKGMQRIKVTAKKVGTEMVNRFKKAGKAIAFGIAAGMTAAGIATIIAAKKILKAGDEIQKMGLKTGFSAEELTRLKHAAELSGGSIEGIDKSIKSMQKSIFDAERGTKLMIDNFAALGLNVDDIKKKSPEEQFKIITERLANIEDPTKRAALAMLIMGRTGRDLLPMLTGGSEGLQKMKDDADKLGITMSGEQVNNIAAFNDSVDRMQKSILGIFQAALGFEDMRFIVDKVTNSIIAFRESVFFQNAVRNITNLASNALAMGNGIINVISKTGASFFKLAGLVGAAAIATVLIVKTGLVFPVIAALAALETFIAGLSLGQAIYDSFDFSNLWKNIKTQFQSGIDNIASWIEYMRGNISYDDFVNQVGEGSEKVEAAWEQNAVKKGSVLEKFKKNLKDSNKDMLNDIGGILGIDSITGEIDKIISSYQEGVGEFEKATMEGNGQAGNKGAIGQQADEAKKLNDQLKKAGKQVSFIVDLNQFKSSKSSSLGGIGSRALRAAGDGARERFASTNTSFRKSFNDINKRHREHFATAGLSDNLKEPGEKTNLGKVTARGFNGVAAVNIGEKIFSHSGSATKLISLAETRNGTLAEMVNLMKRKKGFGSV